MVDNTQQVGNAAGNLGAVGVAWGSFMGWLPEVAALFSIVWLSMQMIIHWPQLKKRIKEIFKR